jgi:hypothetical protein
MKMLPFLPEFEHALRTGRKTCTARTRRYGKAGDVLMSRVGPLRLVRVSKQPLAVVRDDYYRAEGVYSPIEFAQTWNRIHPRKPFDGERMVWLHEFERMPENRSSQASAGGEE